MKKNYTGYGILYFTILFVLLFSCKKDEVIEATRNNYRNFYPLDTGYWIEYKTDSIVHLDLDDNDLIDTSIEYYHFFIREQIDSSFIDLEGDTAFVLSRYKRNSDTLPWEFTALWTAKITSNALERVEDNRRFVRLSFPFSTDNRWNGNAYNELPAEEYSYEDLYDVQSFSGLTFDSTVTVNQNEFISNINRIIRKEIYGNHVGLLYKRSDSIGIGYNTMGSAVILSGLEYEQTVIDYRH